MKAAPLYFLHIPKCGGSTTQTVLGNQFDQNEIQGGWSNWSFLELPPSKQRHVRFIHGHYGWTPHDFFEQKFETFVVVRQPEEWLVSAYFHAWREHTSILHTHARTLSFGKFIRDKQIAIFHRDWQARNIASTFFGNDRFLNPSTISEVTERSRDDVLRCALERLERIEHVGTTERLHDALNLLSFRRGTPPVASPGHHNVGHERRQKFEITSEDIAYARELLAADYEIFEYVRTRFATDFSEYTPRQHLARAIKSKSTITSCPETTFDFARATFGSGLYPRETNSVTGEIQRWSGPDSAFDIWIRISGVRSRRITFLAYACEFEQLENLQVFVNGRLTPAHATRSEGKLGRYAIVRCDVESSCFAKHRGLMHLVFRVPFTVALRDYGAKEDPRSVGIYLRWLEVA